MTEPFKLTRIPTLKTAGAFRAHVASLEVEIPCDGIFTTINNISINKKLVKIIDVLGRETNPTNTPLFYIYDDGTVEKKIIIE